MTFRLQRVLEKFETNLEGKQTSHTLKKDPHFICDSCRIELPPISEKARVDFNIRGSNIIG